MKNYTLLLFASLLLGCSPEDEVRVTVKNSLDIDRVNETVEIALPEIASRMGRCDYKRLVVFDDKGVEIPSQLIYRGEMRPQGLIFQATVGALGEVAYTIRRGTPSEYPQRAYGRFVPERYDDYIWENDRIAFRVYGLALIPKDGPSNGIDVWVKRTDRLVIDRWIHDYKAGVASYHDDNGEGCDSYKVGRTLGAGAMAPYVNDSLWLGINFQAYQTLDNGPIRISFRLNYPPFYVNEARIAETRTITLDAGYQLNAIEEEFEGCDTGMTVAAGIARRKEGRTLPFSAEKGYISYCLDGGKGGVTYVGVVAPSRVIDIKENKSHLMLISNYSKGDKLLYYSGAGWSKWGFETPEKWNSYIEEFAARVGNPLSVSLD